MQLQAVNDGSGNPILTAWVYPQGTSRPLTPTITFTDTNKYYPSAGYVTIGAVNNATYFDNFAIYSADASTAIYTSAVTGVTAPIVGATPVTTASSTSEYTATVSWSPTDNPFVGQNKTYTATITITPAAGYTLTGVPANYFTVAGATTTTNSANSGVVTAVFPETGYIVFQDNFDNDSLGQLSGQNAWTATSSSASQVQAGTQGRQVYFTSGYTITQGSVIIGDVMASVDFQATTTASPGIWLRSNLSGSLGSGYVIWSTAGGGTFYISHPVPGSGTLTSAGLGLVANNSWYTIQFQVVNNANGNPVLTVWIYPQGTSRPTTPTMTYTDTNNYFPSAGYVELGAVNGTTNFDNFVIYSVPSPGSTAPTSLYATPGLDQLSLIWQPPQNTGGNNIIDYQVQYQTGSNATTTYLTPSNAPNAVLTGLNGGALYNLQISSITSAGTSTPLIGLATVPPNITITSPSRSVITAPTTATINIQTSINGCTSSFPIPYIQTGSSLTVSASSSVGSLVTPIAGAKFILDQGSTTQQTIYSMTSSPYTVTFQSVPKGTHNVTVYLIDSSNNIIATGGNDVATNIGIGDIYGAIGDSITNGNQGTGYSPGIDMTSGEVDWTGAQVKSNDNRNYPVCQDSMPDSRIELNNNLENALGYPVFILNLGQTNVTSSLYISSLMQTSWWQNNVNTIKPNKWLIHLGVNDNLYGVPKADWQSNIQWIINTLNATYNAQSIFLATPATGTGWDSYVSSLVSGNADVILGPNFNTFYTNYPSLKYDSFHPNDAGQIHMGYLWANSIAYPQNVSVSNNAGAMTVNWSSLSLGSSVLSTAGYKVSYGTSLGTTTTDVGNVTTKNITGLTSGQTYYFAVSAYDNDPFSPNPTQNSPGISDLLATPPTVTVTPGQATTSLTQTSVTLNATTTSDGSASTTDRGFYYGTSPAYGSVASTTSTQGIGAFSQNLTGLACNTTYHFIAFATNPAGTGTSTPDQTFTTNSCVASAYTFAGPPSGNVGSASTNFTVTPNGPYNGTITLTPTGGFGFSPTILNFSNSATPQTFTITPTTAGSITLTPTNNGSLTDASPLTYTANAVVSGQPTAVSAATSTPNQAMVTFTAPTFTGGFTILYYLASSTPGNFMGVSMGPSSGSIVVSGLTNGTSYTFAVYAVNAIGTSTPSSASNTVTPIGFPGVPTGVTATAGNQQASVTFSAPGSTGGSQITGYTVTSNPSGGTDTNAGQTALTHTVTGLVNGTPYTFTVTATNIVGTGSPSTVSSPVTPSTVSAVSTNSTTNIASTTATLNGSIISTGGSNATEHGFAYGTVANLSTAATTTLGSQSGTGNFSSNVTSLSSNTTYYVRAYAVNAAGTTTGSILLFLTFPAVPTMTTPSPTAGSGIFFTANGNITATGGVNASVRGFVYGTTLAYGATTTENGSFISGAYAASITGLACNTLYHIAAYATNTGGTGYGSDQTITTGVCTKPTVATSTPSGITTTSATLNGAMTADGNASSTVEGFNWGNDTSYGQIASTNGTFGTGSFSQPLTGLACGTTYHYQVFATNVSGQGTSTDQTFSTSACPVTATPTVTTSVSSGGGGSASSQVSNLLALGFLTQAQQVAKQYGLTIPTQNISVNTPTSNSGQPFTRTLRFGVTSSDIKKLQIFLNAQGFVVAQKGAGSPGHETNYFGPATFAALKKFQQAYKKDILIPQGLTSPTGIFGTATMKTVNAMMK
jgi:titin